MRKLILLLYVALLIQGCSQTSTYLDPKEFYSLKDTLRSEILPTPLDTYGSLFYSEYGLFACTKKDNRLFQLLDSTNAAPIVYTGQRGRGPNEFLLVMGMQYDYATNFFSVLDGYRQELVTYSVSPDSISLLKSVNVKKDLQRVSYINDSTLVFVNFYPNQNIGLMSTNAAIIYEQEYDPLGDDRIKSVNGYHNVGLRVSPDKKHTVITNSNFSSVQLFINKPDKLALKWEKMLFKPKYRVNSSTAWLIFEQDHVCGFRSLCLSNQHIYLSCNDSRIIDEKQKKPATKYTYLLVMDYEGNLLKKILMDKNFTTFCVSPDEKSLYAVIEDPDILIAKYKLH